MKRLKMFLLLAVPLGVASCSVDERGAPGRCEDKVVSDMRDYLPEKICLFDPSEFYKGSAVKSSDMESVFIDEGDLDYGSARYYERDSLRYVQIPVSNVGLPDSNVIRFVKIETASEYSRPGSFKTYLVYRSLLDGSRPTASIVMMAYQPKYMAEEEIASLDFFNCEGLNGVIFYGHLDGEIYLVEMVINGMTAGLYEILDPDDGEMETADIRVVIYPDVSPSSSEEDDEWWWNDDIPELIVAICVGNSRGPSEPEPDEPPADGGGEMAGGSDVRDEYVTNIDKGSGGGAVPTDDYVEIVIEEIGRGETTGEGIYQTGFPIMCMATEDYVNGVRTSDFVGWSGDYSSSSPKIIFSKIYPGTYKLTAMFHDYAPCSDSAQGRADPLLEMEILGTINNGIKGGEYGYGRGDFHNGIDLACPVGTPVFAAFDGVVDYIRDDVPSGFGSYDDYRNAGGTYPRQSYNAGNVIYISSVLRGRTYQQCYFHLDKIHVTAGQRVSAGQLIGESGISGNASSPGCAGAHLHFGLRYYGIDEGNFIYIDPADFLYAEFDEYGKNTNDCNE